MPQTPKAHASAQDFAAWRKRMGFSEKAAAQRLGISAQSIAIYERGRRYITNKPAIVPWGVWAHCVLIEQFKKLEEELKRRNTNVPA